MSNPNSFLRDTLRQSLQDVLSEVNLDNDNMTRAPAQQMHQPRVAMQSTFGGFPSSAGSSDNSMKSYGFLSSPGPRNFHMGGNPQVRPSAALGISSQELMMAAAAEKRMLDEKKMLMDLDRARAQLALRQKVLQGAFQGRPQGQNNSLLSLFQNTEGMPQGYNPMNMNMNMNKVHHPEPKDTLQVLGTSLRQSSSPYIDVSDARDPDPNDTRVKKTRGGVTEPFPERLHRLLKEISDDGNGDVISFFGHGRAFGIHKPDKFVNEIMPKYFKQSRLSSFQRQLNLYGFKRITQGRDAGGYYHELFLQGRPNMCLHMRRVGLPKGEDRRKMRSKNVQVDPDFYSMKPVTASS